MIKELKDDTPDTLKFVTNMPLHKKGDKSENSNYRPIALLPVINKIFERIICNRIQYFLDCNKINDKEQYGYKRNIGTNNAILRFSHEITEYLDEGIAYSHLYGQCFIIEIDFNLSIGLYCY